MVALVENAQLAVKGPGRCCGKSSVTALTAYKYGVVGSYSRPSARN